MKSIKCTQFKISKNIYYIYIRIYIHDLYYLLNLVDKTITEMKINALKTYNDYVQNNLHIYKTVTFIHYEFHTFHYRALCRCIR